MQHPHSSNYCADCEKPSFDIMLAKVIAPYRYADNNSNDGPKKDAHAQVIGFDVHGLFLATVKRHVVGMNFFVTAIGLSFEERLSLEAPHLHMA